MKPALLVAALAAAAYLPSLGAVFQFDDYNVIVHYPTVHSWQALFERAGGGVRPLLKASYTLNWTLGFGFSLFNITVHALNAASGFLHRELKHRIQMRRVPFLFFKLDNSIEEGARILAQIDEAVREDSDHGAGPA